MPAAFEFESHITEMTNFAKIWQYMDSPDFRRKLLNEIGETAVALVQQEFETGRNPYGKRWAPDKPPRTIGGNRILNKTGALANTIRYKIVGETVVVYSPLKYSIFHQRGTKRMPQRLIFPDDLIGLPERWKRAFDGAASVAFQRLLKQWAFD